VQKLSYMAYLRSLFAAFSPANTPTTTTTNANQQQVRRISPDLAFFIVSKGVEVYLKMLLTDNLMHADLHPGNIFLRQHDEHGRLVSASQHSSLSPDARVFNKIVLVDAGMVATLLHEEQDNFIGLLQSMGRGRGDEAAEHLLKFSSRRDYTEAQRSGFKSDMVVLFSERCRGYHHDVKIGDVLKGILHLVRIHKVTIEANYATLVMNALCLDSLAGSLMPSYNVLDGAKQLLQFHRIARKALGEGLFRKLVPMATAIKGFCDNLFEVQLRRRERRKRSHASRAVDGI
jgi:aarF domain-containing kinase